MASSDFKTAQTTAVDHGGEATISALHPDIIRAHILARLDGPALASAACASSSLHALSADESLWRDVCRSMWPSVADPRLRHLISSFPSGHRSFFSDSFPILDRVPPHEFNPNRPSPSSGLISAVDIYYQGKLVLSRVQETETVSEWFLCSPFLVDLLDPKDSVPTQIRRAPTAAGNDDGAWLKHLEENLTLSWILIDPTQKRAANLSSRRPVSVWRHWLTGEIQLRFASVMVGDGGCSSSRRWLRSAAAAAPEMYQCGILVTCGGDKEGGELHVREVGMHVEDMEGKHLNGKESLLVLGNAMDGGVRRKARRCTDGRERYEAYLELRRERRERKQRRESALDFACIVTGVSIFVLFWSLLLFR
ncbi:F-box domain containing protein [Trema orientale]|uniref:F-box domain containing protein n=1 Tax=Trema orientale TaxID=63057 RepID=A0A2P5CW23_TREOI|nr:F-box domain containing protein [Trema orientale]